MIDRINEHIEFHKSIDSHKSDVAFLNEVKDYVSTLENNLELTKEDLECAHMWLGFKKYQEN